MTMLPVLLVPVAFVAIWLLAMALASRLGGWHALADRFAAPEGFAVAPEQRLRFRSIVLRRLPLFPARYSGCVTVGLTSVGLYLGVLAILRFRHPPLLIPWNAIRQCEEDAFLGLHWTDVEVRDADPVIRVVGAAGEAVAQEWRRAGPGGDTGR
jgi:hypothetical protein